MSTPIRNEWTFRYPVSELATAAEAKHKYHSERLDWWVKKKEEVLTKIKAEGLEIDESVALGYSNSMRSTSVNVRNDLLTDLNECIGKEKEHRAKVREYDGWQQVLQAQVGRGGAILDLHHEDWLFFFGK